MSNLKSIWTDEYRVSWFDADGNNRARLAAICRYLQESAWNHANHLGFGYRQASEIKQVWVIIRLLLKMEKYPFWDDIITVRTWPRGVEGVLAFRDFEILSAAGERLGAASSQLNTLLRPGSMRRFISLRVRIPGNGWSAE
jgi:acyl-ACP thioesterase